jgi:hypothetical protein
MGQRDAPTAAHPAPADDWILGSDGHWKPPPMMDSGTKRTRSTVVVEDPVASRRVGPAVIISVMLVVAAVAYLAYIALHA